MKLRVYYEDTDVGGVVYHTNYIKYCERARSEMFFEENIKLGEDNSHFVVTKMEVEFKKPAFLGDILEVKTELLEMRNASLIALQTIYKDDKKLFIAKITVAFTKDGKPLKIPENMKSFFLKKYK